VGAPPSSRSGLVLPFLLNCRDDRERAKSQRRACAKLEKEEAKRLALVSLASAMGCTYRTITSYYRVSRSVIVQD